VLRHVAGVTLLNFIEFSDINGEDESLIMSSNETVVLSAGPMIVTLEEITELNKLCIQTRKNGQSDKHSKALTFPLKEIISYVSVFSQLNAGDIIATPFGVDQVKIRTLMQC
jgi:2-keto-4-pentenoate hydratase/2-oxohepta-3-ene-1,7-dioic acid hydratase (catechol pathway)